MKTLSIVAANGVPFTVRLVETGDKYGLDFCLTHDDVRPMVEFYDARYPHTPNLGQFVSRYYVNMILDPDSSYGLDLCGYVDSWKVDAASMGLVRDWLVHHLDRVNVYSLIGD